MTSKTAKWIGVCACIPVVLPLTGWAEEGLRATLGVSGRLESVNKDGFTTEQDEEGTRFLTRLNFGLTSEARFQRLEFSAGTSLAQNFSNGEFEGEDPTLRLNYNLENRGSVLTFGSSFQRRDVDQSNFDLEDEDVEVGDGERTIRSFNTGLTIGRDGPVRFDLSQRYSRSTFSDTVDPDLSDSTRENYSARVTFRISPVLSTNIFATRDTVDRDNAGETDTEDDSFGVGASYEISPVLTVNGQVSYDSSESTSATSQDSDGLGYRLDLSRALANGALTAGFTSTETINGTRYQIRAGRSLSLPRGSISFSLGATKLDGTSAEPLVNLGLDYALTDASQISVSLSQSSTVNQDDDESVRTRLGINYTHTLSEISSISAGAQLASSNDLSDGGIDRSSLSADLTYRRAVGGDWNMVTGYSYSTSRRDGQEDRNTSTVFLGLEKSFDFRP
ncbi:MtrB/PioB family outer membrane beta-barrel protein [Roseobacter sp. A03A-229]